MILSNILNMRLQTIKCTNTTILIFQQTNIYFIIAELILLVRILHEKQNSSTIVFSCIYSADTSTSANECGVGATLSEPTRYILVLYAKVLAIY